jgi:hypothetical protein
MGDPQKGLNRVGFKTRLTSPPRREQQQAAELSTTVEAYAKFCKAHMVSFQN